MLLNVDDHILLLRNNHSCYIIIYWLLQCTTLMCILVNLLKYSSSFCRWGYGEPVGLLHPTGYGDGGKLSPRPGMGMGMGWLFSHGDGGEKALLGRVQTCCHPYSCSELMSSSLCRQRSCCFLSLISLS